MALDARPIAALMLLMSCGPAAGSETTSDGSGVGSSETGHASSTSNASTGGATEEWPPSECLHDGALGDVSCLSALRSTCLAATNEEDCEGAEPFFFEGTGQYASCGWVGVVPVVDAASCELGPPTFRCEAWTAMVPPDGFPDPSCDPTQQWSFGEGELVGMATGPHVTAPIGPWAPFAGDDAPAYPFASCTTTSAPIECACTQDACALVSE